jgi:hypothetical protein
MAEQIDSEVYLYVSNKKLKIFLFDKKISKNLYEDQLIFDTNFDFIDFSLLTKFLDKNIYHIEKIMSTFLKNIFLIIEYDENLIVKIGRKMNSINMTDHKDLKNILLELKSIVNENYQNQSIMHILFNNHSVDEKKYSSVDHEADPLWLEINFITIPTQLIFVFDKILERYQIKIVKYFDGNYIKNYFKDENMTLSSAANKLGSGHNKNEVILIPKSIENKGFFEKFFNLFS